ncbi:MAG: ferritin-like domain-containing protein [Bdellovibrionales bacterium]|nr:ferritin-like domain-containing protein [Bdellovibrionales bacterium]
MKNLKLTKESILNYGHIDSDHRIHTLLDRAVTSKIGDKRKVENNQTGSLFWDLDHYGISSDSKLRKIFEETEVHKELNIYTMTEACSIEKLGFAFNSKMMTMSETLEEKSLYANFAFDEMLHLRSLLNFVDFDLQKTGKLNPLLDALVEIVAEGDQLSTMFILQIALEGMGIAHYTWLANNCQNPGLKDSFLTIVKDEAFHHGGGIILFPKTELKAETVEFIVHTLKKIVKIFYSWPHPYWLAIEKGTGSLTSAQMNAFSDRDGFILKARTKASKFKELIYSHAPENLIVAIEMHGVFNDLEYAAIEGDYLENISPIIHQ